MSQKCCFGDTFSSRVAAEDLSWERVAKTRFRRHDCQGDVTRKGSWDDWLIYVLRGVEETASWTTAKIGAVRKLSADTAAYVRRELPKIHSRELVDVIFEQPYCRIANLVESGIAGRQAASRYLKALVAAGVLEERAIGKEKLFVHPKLMNLLTRDGNTFAAYR